MTNSPPPSKNEDIKAKSQFLRGTITEGLARHETGALADDDTQLTKFHGIYQQDDRDLRPERGKRRMEKAFSFMARVRVPAGILTAQQWLAMDRLARERSGGTLRLTTRQTIQFHGIIKSNLKPAIQAINAALLDTIAACGDVNRNVLATANPYESAAHEAVAEAARTISAHLLPRTRAWHEIWIDGEKILGGEAEVESEPIYGATYMPRKFKIAIAVPPRNDVDVYAHDLGLIAIAEEGKIVGYNVTVGGGMGMTHGDSATFPRVGDLIGYVPAEQVVDLAEKVVLVQRDFGDRAERKHARLKYTIADRGIPWFMGELTARLGWVLQPPRPFSFDATGDRLGWSEGEDGKFHFTLFVENGRLSDRPGHAVLSALAEIASTHQGVFIITANQNLVIADIPRGQREAVEAALTRFGLSTPEGGLRRNSMACVALPTCGLALAESERYLPTLVSILESELAAAGLEREEIVIRMTGCPNGCARPYLAEIGLVGRNPGLYNLYLGAAFDGSRLNRLYRADLDQDGIITALRPLFRAFAKEHAPGEHFGDFAMRTALAA